MRALFVFAGQGAQIVGMGRDLAECSPAARSVFEQADSTLGYALSEIMWNGSVEQLTDSKYCQTAIYTMSCAALAAFRERFEVVPAACAGLSLGEYGALYCGGAFSFDTGIRLLARRGELMGQACSEYGGGMASVLGAEIRLVEDTCAKFDVDIANYNCPGQIVISGISEKVQLAIEALKAVGVRRIIPLNVAGAFHSRLMRSAGEKLADDLARADIVVPAVPVYHNYTAAVAKDADEIRSNLSAQVSGSVRWEMCVRNAVSQYGVDTVCEFGPGAVLTGLARRTIPELRLMNVNGADALDKITI